MNSRLLPLLVCSLALGSCARHSGDAPGFVIGFVPVFETRTEIATRTGTHADFAVADFNGDNDLDMAIVGLDGSLQVMLGGNQSTFATGQELTLSGAPIWIAAGDLDGDGDRDLAVVRTDANETSILLNDGAANFTPGPVLPVGRGALAVVLADANDDGIIDVIVARLESPEIAVFLNNGAGTFTAGTELALPGGGTPFNMAVADVNQDQILDLVVCDSARDRVLIYFGGGGGKDFQGVPHEVPVAGAPKAVAIGDLSGDGLPDLAVSAFDANRFVILTDYLGATVQSLEVPVGAPPSVSTIADVTGDGLPDLVACVLSRASVTVVPQVAGGGLGAPFLMDAGGLPLRPVVGDVNGDNRNDLLVLSGLHNRINLWLAKADGTLAGARNHETSLPSSLTVAGGDFDRDGVADAIVGSPDSTFVSVMTRGTGLAMDVARRIDVGRVVFRVVAADIDRDGQLDVVLAVDGGTKILRNRSAPGAIDFEVLPDAAGGVFGTASGPFGVAVADLDRDGVFDLITADFQAGNLMWLKGTGVPFAFDVASVNSDLGPGLVDVTVADFTGDGILDVAVSRGRNSDIVVLRNDGAGGLSRFATVPVGRAPNYLITADFDGDRRADLVVSNGDDATITILFARGNGFEPVSFPAGETPTALLARDLTGDGTIDLLVASLVRGDFRVLAGDGSGGFPLVLAFPGTLGATSAVLQDMDGDALPELLIGSIVTTRLSVVKNISQPALRL